MTTYQVPVGERDTGWHSVSEVVSGVEGGCQTREGGLPRTTCGYAQTSFVTMNKCYADMVQLGEGRGNATGAPYSQRKLRGTT